LDGGSVAQFENSGGDDHFTRLNPFLNGDKIAPRDAKFDDLLTYAEVL
jgi:hypothetical protein